MFETYVWQVKIFFKEKEERKKERRGRPRPNYSYSSVNGTIKANKKGDIIRATPMVQKKDLLANLQNN